MKYYPSERYIPHLKWLLDWRWDVGCWWDQKDHQHKIEKHRFPNYSLELYLAIRFIACKRQHLHTCKLNDRFDCRRIDYINEIILIAGWSFGSSYITRRITPIIYLGHKEYFETLLFINEPTPILMNNIHLHVSMSVTMVGVVDYFSKNLMVEGIVKGMGEYLVERFQDLVFDVWGLYVSGCIEDHFLNIIKICLVEWIKSLDFHDVVGDIDGSKWFLRRYSPAKKTFAKTNIFIVGEIVRQYWSWIINKVP